MRLNLSIVAMLLTALLLTSCSGEYVCDEYAIVVEADGSLHLYGSDCEYDYQIPLPESLVM